MRAAPVMSLLEENTVEGLGRFSVFSNGYVRVLFEDRTCLEMTADLTNRLGESHQVQPVLPTPPPQFKLVHTGRKRASLWAIPLMFASSLNTAICNRRFCAFARHVASHRIASCVDWAQLSPSSHRTQNQICAQICMQIFRCCFQTL